MKKIIDKYLGYFLAGLMMLMTVDVLWGVITRYALGGQADWTEELARYLLIWIGLLGAAYASGQNMHLAIDLLMAKLKPKGQSVLFLSINVLIILFAFFVMVVGGTRLLYITQSLGQLSAALRVPIAAVYAVLPLSGLLVIYYRFYEIFHWGKLSPEKS
ncbi:MAG: TRAP transporter small permease [Bacteroidia bacterium]|nr:TRAP transporter small permease [Bacteroidia bacterium]